MKNNSEIEHTTLHSSDAHENTNKLDFGADGRGVSHLIGVFVPEGDAEPCVICDPLRFPSSPCVGTICPQLFMFAVPALRLSELDVVLVRNRGWAWSKSPSEARARPSGHGQKPSVDQKSLGIGVPPKHIDRNVWVRQS